ncbi:TPA: ComEC/Rec2 family competence protein [Vibrio diabolicus]
MNSVNLTILDIGHGNSTLIHSSDSAVLIDSANGAHVQNILVEKNIVTVDSIIISHSDSDHIGGAVAILLDENITVKKVLLNSDSAKKTKIWEEFLQALTIAREEKGTKVVASIDKDSENLRFSNFELEVLSPNPVDGLTGPGTKSVKGNKLDANSMSVVLRLVHQGEKIALITGDMDANSLIFLKSEVESLGAKILIFPHHGGLPNNSDPMAFSKELCDLVSPELIVFSNSRSKHNNPRNEIIEGIKKSSCKAVIACTQLSKDCCKDESRLSSEHLIATFPSVGKSKHHSCAGTLTFVLNGVDTDIAAVLSQHANYISNFENRKCI